MHSFAHIAGIENMLEHFRENVLNHNGEIHVITPNKRCLDSIKNEITSHNRIISGGTGIPVQFLGLPDLLSNRASAENLMEMVNASTSKDRAIWQGFYEELFQKVLEMANDELQGGFTNILGVSASIPPVSLTKMQELIDVWLPLYQAGTISRETLWTKIPEIDAEAEGKRLKEAQENVVIPINANVNTSAFPEEVG